MPRPDKARPRRPAAPSGPSQRQLRAGELVRHSLAAILALEEVQDPDLKGVAVTVTEVRMSADLKHATCFVQPLGAGLGGAEPSLARRTVAALERNARFLRGRLGREVLLKFTPELRFVHDQSFGAAAAMEALFARPEVARDLVAPSAADEES